MIKEFLEEIKELHYVVQRNWENLPDGFTEGHEDLDLFVSKKDREKIVDIALKYPKLKIDIRSFLDDYYPENIGRALLTERILEKDLFWIPNTMAHFMSLYYHNLVHKEGNPYKKKLEEIFKETFPPVRCKDEGVGYFI